MKAKDFSSFSRQTVRHARRPRRRSEGPRIGAALLGVVCVAGVFGVLTLLFQLG